MKRIASSPDPTKSTSWEGIKQAFNDEQQADPWDARKINGRPPEKLTDKQITTALGKDGDGYTLVVALVRRMSANYSTGEIVADLPAGSWISWRCGTTTATRRVSVRT